MNNIGKAAIAAFLFIYAASVLAAFFLSIGMFVAGVFLTSSSEMKVNSALSVILYLQSHWLVHPFAARTA